MPPVSLSIQWDGYPHITEKCRSYSPWFVPPFMQKSSGANV